MQRSSSLWILVALALMLPSLAAAQGALARGTLTGTVRDASGGVLPGVTVEASSPALIEKVRTVVTDECGHLSHRQPRPRRLYADVHARRASARSSARAWS